MRKVTLRRVESGDQGTFGVLEVENLPFCYTGELPERGNHPDFSRIPAGEYHCVFVYSPHFRRRTYHLSSVPERSSILIHSANFMGDRELGFRSQLHGCIALGERIGEMDGQKALLLSAPAVRKFENYMSEEPFILEIIDGTDIGNPGRS